MFLRDIEWFRNDVPSSLDLAVGNCLCPNVPRDGLPHHGSPWQERPNVDLNVFGIVLQRDDITLLFLQHDLINPVEEIMTFSSLFEHERDPSFSSESALVVQVSMFDLHL